MTRTVATLSNEFENFKSMVEKKLVELTEGLNAVKVAVVRAEPGKLKDMRNEIDEIKKIDGFHEHTV